MSQWHHRIFGFCSIANCLFSYWQARTYKFQNRQASAARSATVERSVKIWQLKQSESNGRMEVWDSGLAFRVPKLHSAACWLEKTVDCCAAGEIDENELNKVNPYVIAVSFFSIVFAGVAGSAYAIYKEVNFPLPPPLFSRILLCHAVPSKSWFSAQKILLFCSQQETMLIRIQTSHTMPHLVLIPIGSKSIEILLLWLQYRQWSGIKCLNQMLYACRATLDLGSFGRPFL